MALKIANPIDVDEVERVARATGLSKPATVERAEGQPLREASAPLKADVRMAALLVQLDRIPDRNDAFDPLCWDKHGLPVHAVVSLATE